MKSPLDTLDRQLVELLQAQQVKLKFIKDKGVNFVTALDIKVE